MFPRFRSGRMKKPSGKSLIQAHVVADHLPVTTFVHLTM